MIIKTCVLIVQTFCWRFKRSNVLFKALKPKLFEIIFKNLVYDSRRTNRLIFKNTEFCIKEMIVVYVANQNESYK
jgi:hypothetical protein